MKSHVYPDDLKPMPIKRLSPDQQRPFVERAQRRHQLWNEITRLEARGYGPKGKIPVRDLVQQFRKQQPDRRHVTLFQATAMDIFRLETSFYDRDLSKARPRGNTVRVGRDLAATVGAAIADENQPGVAQVLSDLLSALPGTFAGQKDNEQVPADEAGLVALGGHLSAERGRIAGYQQQIETLNQEIDQRAWELYRPRKTKRQH